MASVEWCPRVTNASRVTFEAQQTVWTQTRYNRTFYIGDFGAGSSLDYGKSYAEYYPVQFVEPYAGNEIILGVFLQAIIGWSNSAGFNSGNEEFGETGIRAAIIQSMKDTGNAIFVNRLKLFASQTWGSILYTPLFRDGSGTWTLKKQTDFAGFIAGVYDANQLLVSAAQNLTLPSVDLYLYNQYGLFMAAFAGNKDGYFTKDRLKTLEETKVDTKIDGEEIKKMNIQVTPTMTYTLIAVARAGFTAGVSTVIPIVVVVLTSFVLLFDEFCLFLIKRKI